MTISSEDVRAEFRLAQAMGRPEGGQTEGDPDGADRDASGSETADAADDLIADQQAHQDHGQGYIASEGETDTGAAPEADQP